MSKICPIEDLPSQTWVHLCLGDTPFCQPSPVASASPQSPQNRQQRCLNEEVTCKSEQEMLCSINMSIEDILQIPLKDDIKNLR